MAGSRCSTASEQAARAAQIPLLGWSGTPPAPCTASLPPAAPPIRARFFKLPKKGKFSVLYSFSGGLDGSTPAAPLIFDPAGNLYGTTYLGGSPNCNAYRYTDCGTVFELTTTGHEKVLHRFSSQRKNGDFPSAGLLRDAAGNLNSTTYVGGPGGAGTVFELDPAGHEIYPSCLLGSRRRFAYVGIDPGRCRQLLRNDGF